VLDVWATVTAKQHSNSQRVPASWSSRLIKPEKQVKPAT